MGQAFTHVDGSHSALFTNPKVHDIMVVILHFSQTQKSMILLIKDNYKDLLFNPCTIGCTLFMKILYTDNQTYIFPNKLRHIFLLLTLKVSAISHHVSII